MAVQEKANLLAARISEQIEAFSSRRRANKRKAFMLRFAVVLCSALTTLLIGLNSLTTAAQPIVKDIALGFSALVTAITAIEAFFNHRSLWIRYTVASNKLKAARAKLEYLTSGDLQAADQDRVDKLFEEFQQILTDTNEDWLKLRKDSDEKEGS